MEAALQTLLLQKQNEELCKMITELRKDINKVTLALREKTETVRTTRRSVLVEVTELEHRLILVTELVSQGLFLLLEPLSPYARGTLLG